MERIIYFFLTFVAIQTCKSCNSDFLDDPADSNFPEPLANYTVEHGNLNYTAGDIISCQNNQNFKCFRNSGCLTSETSRIFLASSNSTVIYARQINAYAAYIVEESLLEATKGKAEHCKVITDLYDDWVQEGCHQRRYYTKYGIENAVSQAGDSIRTFRGEAVYYDPVSCNSEHWVSSWRYHVAMARSIETNRKEQRVSTKIKHASDVCKAPGMITCPSCGTPDW